jgi:hypothetical protein
LNGKVAAPGLENRDYQLKLALTSPAGCGRSVGIVRLRTKDTEFKFKLFPGILKLTVLNSLGSIETDYGIHMNHDLEMTSLYVFQQHPMSDPQEISDSTAHLWVKFRTRYLLNIDTSLHND